MTRDEAVDILMGRLARRSSTVTQQDIINEMVFVQEFTLEGDPTPLWFLLTESASTNTVVGDERIPTPSDFIMEWDEGALYIVNEDASVDAMKKDDWETIKERITGTGKPQYYDLAGKYFLVRHIPDAIYELRMRYYATQASLAGVYGDSANVENGWLKHAADWFVAEVGIVIANQYLQSSTMVELFMRQAATAKDRLIRKDTMMREINKQRFMEG